MKTIYLAALALTSTFVFAGPQEDRDSRAQYAEFVVQEFHNDLPRFLAKSGEQLAEGSIDCSVDPAFQGIFRSVETAIRGECKFRTASGRSCESRFEGVDNINATRRLYHCEGGKWLSFTRSAAARAYNNRVYKPVPPPRRVEYGRYTYPSGNALIDASCQQNPGTCNYNYGYYKRGL